MVLLYRIAKIPKLGMIEPKMGMTSSSGIEQPHSLADALFPRVRQRVLVLLFGNSDRSFFTNEIVALAQSGTGAVQRELASLEAVGLIAVEQVGNQKHYKANVATPVFEELRSLVLKTSGLVDILRTALAPLAGDIEVAFIYGSVAKQQDTASSDVDVMVISDSLAYAEAFQALEAAAQRAGRKINPTIYPRAQWTRRIKQRNVFTTKVVSQPKLWLIGTEEDLRGIDA
jgi:predicted nucleotidyltransferase